MASNQHGFGPMFNNRRRNRNGSRNEPSSSSAGQFTRYPDDRRDDYDDGPPRRHGNDHFYEEDFGDAETLTDQPRGRRREDPEEDFADTQTLRNEDFRDSRATSWDAHSYPERASHRPDDGTSGGRHSNYDDFDPDDPMTGPFAHLHNPPFTELLSYRRKRDRLRGRVGRQDQQSEPEPPMAKLNTSLVTPDGRALRKQERLSLDQFGNIHHERVWRSTIA